MCSVLFLPLYTHLFLMTCLLMSVIGPIWYLKKLRPKETNNLAKGSKQSRWGEDEGTDSHTTEVSATHIVWSFYKYYCT